MKISLRRGAVMAVAMLASTNPPAQAQIVIAPSAAGYTCHTDIELPLLALSPNALAVQVERPVAARVSILAAMAIRDGADGDFQSTTGALAVSFVFGCVVRIDAGSQRHALNWRLRMYQAAIQVAVWAMP